MLGGSKLEGPRAGGRMIKKPGSSSSQPLTDTGDPYAGEWVDLRQAQLENELDDDGEASMLWRIQISHWKIQVNAVALEDPSARSKFRLRWRIRRQDPNPALQYAGGSVEKPRRIRRVRWKIHERAGG
jgi:hypothetical protein